MTRRNTAILVASALFAAACGERGPEGSVLLTASRIYTAPDQAPIDDGAILMQDGRILAVGPRAAVAARGARRLERCDVGYMSDYDSAEEYRQMARALTPMQILASLTTAPAARWKEESSRGRVAIGLNADLVVLDADPAEDAAHFAGVRCTIRAAQAIFEAPPPGR